MSHQLRDKLYVVAIVASVIFVLFLPLLIMLGTDVSYDGDHPELYTVAINNFLGCHGFGSNGEASFSSELGKLETDKYGRVMFYYHEGKDIHGYGILQKAQDGYAYFYEDDSVICADYYWSGSGKIDHTTWFTQEQINELKKRNDWNQPINEMKCKRANVVTEMPKSQLKIKDQEFNRLAKSYFSQIGIPYTEQSVYHHDNFFIADAYGREIYFVCCVTRGVENPEYYYLVMMFNPDGTCTPNKAIMLIKNTEDYREALKAFKEQNGWATEYKGTS